MDSDLALDLIVRLSFCGPLLYIGLTLIIDPASVFSILATCADVVRTFDLRLRGPRLEQPQFSASKGALRAARLTGFCLSACSLLPFTPLVR